MNLERPVAPHPHDSLPPLDTFDVTSSDFKDGDDLDLKHVHGSAKGQNISPNLQWSGAPLETQSYAVTCFDPDAPTGSGWWHWLVVDIPASVTELVTGAADDGGSGIPEPAFELRSDFGEMGYGGAAPPPGDRPHRYIFAVHALDVPRLGITPDTPAAIVGFNLTAHSLARGHITAYYAH